MDTINNKDSFYTISKVGESTFRDRGSRFIGRAYSVENEEDVKNVLQNLRKEFYDARHHCYSYILGVDKELFRINDDGEPSGSAGKPIHGQILSTNTSNILVVVIRYFGGTKLGVPGLINAYKSAAREAIEDGDIIEKSIDHTFQVFFEYASMNTIMNFVKEENLKITFTKFELECEIHFLVNRAQEKRILQKIKELRVITKDIEVI